MKMPTDDERREVARRLRSFVTDDSMNATVDVSHVLYVLGLHYADVDRIYFCGYDAARLADLIEPSERKVRCVAEVKVDGERLEKLAYDAAVELTGVDRDALLALADEMERKASNWDVTQGDVPLVHAGYLMGYADRIREALGDCQRGVSGVGCRGASRGPSGQVAGVARAAPREGAGEKE